MRNRILQRLENKRKQGGVRKYHEGGWDEHQGQGIDPLAIPHVNEQPHGTDASTNYSGSPMSPNYSGNAQNAAYLAQQGLVHRGQNWEVPEWTKYLGNPWAGLKAQELVKASDKGGVAGVLRTAASYPFKQAVMGQFTGLGKDLGVGVAKGALSGLGKKLFNPFQEGGVRHQTGGMYDQMRQYKNGGESKKERKNRIKNYTHPYLQQYYDEFATKGNISSEKEVRDILSSMNVTPSDTAFINQSPDRNMVRSMGNMDVNQYIGSQIYDDGSGSYNLGYDDKMPYYTSDPDEEGVSWDFMQNLYHNDADTYTGVLKSKKQTGGMYNQMRQYQMGGQQLPGGEMQPIPGSDAVQFSGADHDEGGIMMDNITEVEDGETMDQVTMAKEGGERDYFFSSHLKKGGVPFSELHKEILANGGNQDDINMLARMQENKAGRTTDKIGTAKLGGVMKYQNGGPDYTKISTQDVASKEYYDPEEYGEIAAMQKSKTFTLDSGNEITLYGDKHLFEQIEAKGTDTWLKDMYANADPAILEAAGITSYDQMGSKSSNLAYQKAWNAANPKNPIKEDSLWGEQTTRTMFKKAGEDKEMQPQKCPEGQIWDEEMQACVLPTVDVDDVKKPSTTTPKQKDYIGSLLGLGSMIPAVMAFTEKPDYMKHPDLQAPGIVKAERVAKQHLDRIDMNDQLARNAADSRAMNEYINTSGGGPATMANKMAVYAKKQEGDRNIKAQEHKANIAVANEEAVLDNKRKAYNAESALDASKFNVSAADKADMANIRNAMYIDEFNRGADAATKDRRLNAVQYGINTLATLYRDKLTRGASDNLALAIDGQRGALDRFYEEQNAKRGGYRRFELLRRKN